MPVFETGAFNPSATLPDVLLHTSGFVPLPKDLLPQGTFSVFDIHLVSIFFLRNG